MKVAALIPVYNEEDRIGGVVERIKQLKIVEEIVVVDDGSKDRSSLEAKKAGATVLRHPMNRGKGEALKTGFKYILKKNLEGVITLDGDGQHAPEEIPKMLKKAEESGADIVVGSRMYNPQNMPFVRYLTNIITSWLTSLLCGERVRDSQCGFRFIKREVVEKVNLECSHFEIESEILIKAGKKGFRIVEVPITTIYLEDSTKRSKIKPWRDTLRFIKLVWRNL